MTPDEAFLNERMSMTKTIRTYRDPYSPRYPGWVPPTYEVLWVWGTPVPSWWVLVGWREEVAA